jgi:hypothetical protein
VSKQTIWLDLAPNVGMEVDFNEAFLGDERWFAALYKRHVYGAKRGEAKAWAKRQIAERDAALRADV